jgi:U3 small nucleolar RNA-associated protein 7
MDPTDTIDVPVTKVQQNGALSVQGARTALRSKGEIEKLCRARKYDRGRPVNTKNIRDPKLRRTLRTLEDKYQTATIRASEAEILDENSPGFLEPEGELERTYRVRQDDILQDSAIATAQSRFELKYVVMLCLTP